MTSGLNLDVMDYYTGKHRTVETLSGGETFLASLSLALGLSDAVQRRSGGVQLDTMLIDEGFGSLDGLTLDSAVHLLEQLSDHNRMIGIISHVAALSERFDKQIVVEKTPHGSRIFTRT
jgi:exonuclease SbcC